jgi:3',5'-cyclic AMP phosphodiesterase CpdA
MKPSKFIAFVAGLLVVCRVALGDFRFVHITDTHFGAGNNQQADIALFKEISALDPPPAFVINTGDVCEMGSDDEYAQFREALQSLKPKMYVAPGNHDVRWNPRGKEGYTRGADAPLYQSWDYQNIHFVTLDSTALLQHWGHISRDQLDWLKADLQKVGIARPVVIGFHHWIARDTVMVDNEQELLDLVEPYNVVLWLQGHGHSDIQWNINGAPAVMQAGLYQGSYMTVDVKEDRMILRRRSLVPPKQRKNPELVRDASVSPMDEMQWTELMTVPLKKPPAPKLKQGEPGTVHFENEPDVPGATMEYSMDGGEYRPLRFDQLPSPSTVPAGIHQTRVRDSLPDGRTYFHY